jgi:hypothetical protein
VAATTKEEDVKSRDDGRRRRTPIEWLTPEQLAWAHENALRWRAEFRSGTALEPASAPPAAARPASAKDEARRRARFAAAVARAEFGRFYRLGQDAKMPPPMRADDPRRKP